MRRVDEPRTDLMELWQAIILGIVEGITEYLPVSSTGHLLVAQRMLGIEATEAANAYAIAIQAGAILAVLGLYRKRVAQVTRGLLGRDDTGKQLLVCLGVAFLPAAVLGFALDDTIEALLFGPWPIVFAWVVGAIAIFVWAPRLVRPEAGGITLEKLGWRAALVVGSMQCLALWPGTSRSLATIFGGLVAGLSLGAAVEFSFLLGVLTLGAATIYKALQHGGAMLAAFGPLPLIVGFLVAWVSAVLAIRGLLTWINRGGLHVFGWWRLGAAAVVAYLALAGSL